MSEPTAPKTAGYRAFLAPASESMPQDYRYYGCGHAPANAVERKKQPAWEPPRRQWEEGTDGSSSRIRRPPYTKR